MEAFVRPFTGRLVRDADAGRAVVPMPETGDRTPVPLDPAAYDDATSAVYRYRQRTADGDHTGLVVAMAVAAFADGRVLGHEAVRPDRVEALVDHLAAAPERVELVTTLHRAGPRFTAALGVDAGDPLVDVVTDDGHRHTVWRLPDDRALLTELDRARHYVADGHHRVAASRVLWERAGRPPELALVCVVHADDGLTLEAFHRLLDGPVDPGPLLDRLGSGYDVVERDDPQVGPWDVEVRLAGRWYAARRRAAHPSGVLPLGVALLEDTLAPIALEPVRASVDELRELADRTGGAGFVLQPPPINAVLGLADAGRVLPAKTTYFRPKPASGLFVRSVPG